MLHLEGVDAISCLGFCSTSTVEGQPFRLWRACLCWDAQRINRMEVGEIHVKFSGFSLVFRLRNMQHRCDVGGGDHHFGDEDDESDE